MIWQRRPGLFATGLALAAFAAGLIVGARFFRQPVIYREIAAPSGNPNPAPSVGGDSACVDFGHAASLAGRTGCVSGIVQRVYTARSGNTFLDFCENFRDCPFTSLIFAADKSNFGDLTTLEGKRVELRGEITTYQGRPEIVVRTADQIRSAP